MLTPLAVDPSHPFPQLAQQEPQPHRPPQATRRKRDFQRHRADSPRARRGCCSSRKNPRANSAPGCTISSCRTSIKHYLARLFPGWRCAEAHAFRMTRNSDLYIDEEEAENLLHTIEEELRRQSRGNAVRLEVQADTPPEMERFLLETFRLTEADLYRLPGPINFLHLQPLFSSDAFPRLRDRPFQPVLAQSPAAERGYLRGDARAGRAAAPSVREFPERRRSARTRRGRSAGARHQDDALPHERELADRAGAPARRRRRASRSRCSWN